MNRLYKMTFLAALLFVICGLSAQNFNYDFEQCNIGYKVAETLGDPWTTWNLNPGSTEDAVISDEHCQGARALKIDNGNDLVLKLGNKTSGAYNISFYMYIPEGKEGYFNVLHEFAGSNSVWAFEAFFKSRQHGNYISCGTYDPFDVPYNEWFKIDIDIYLDDALACLKINDQPISVWDYTNYNTLKYCSIAAMNFYPCSSTTSRNGYYVDNISFTEIEGPIMLDLVSENETIETVMMKDEQYTVSNNVTNEGKGIGDIDYLWVDYGLGQDGGEQQKLHYDFDPYYSFGNYNDDPYIEIGISFQPDSMPIGTKITKMQYYVPYDAQWGCEGPLTFRIYKSTIYNKVIAEKVLNEYEYNAWNTVEFDEPIPLRGYPILASVGFQQVDGGYPISLDAGPALSGYADLVRLNDGDWFSLNENSIWYNGEDYGNHNIRLICEGVPVATKWVKMTHSGTAIKDRILPGESLETQFAFNTEGLDYGSYEAVFRFETCNESFPEITVPIKLKVSGADVDELKVDVCKAYPNPTSGKLTIEVEGLKQINISNLLGQVVFEGKAVGNVFEYNFGEYESGVYLIRIETENGMVTKRVTVTR